MAMTNDDNPEEKLKIVHFLLQAGIDVNFVTKSEHRNALHYFTIVYGVQILSLLWKLRNY
ncbi:ankyrin repeat family protein [Lactiplantibacillus plantarum subsp. plantarum]|nr:ankyrin repeat family protein [Lactiplantibacillus plantarum subsp. plantarum]